MSSLKRFRERSLANPAWIRDDDHVLVYLTSGTIPTANERRPEASPLAEPIDAATVKLQEFRRYALRHERARRAGADPVADAKWTEVLAAIDTLVARAEELHGRRLSYRS